MASDRKVCLRLDREKPAKLSLEGDVDGLNIVIPYNITPSGVVFSAEGKDGQFTLRIENDSALSCPMIILQNPQLGMRPVVLFASIGDPMEKFPEAAGKLCVIAQDGHGSWQKRHLMTSAEIKKTESTSRK